MPEAKNVTWQWLERLVVLGGVIVSVVLYISTSKADLEQHKAVETKDREKQQIVDEQQNTRLAKLETLMERAIEQQQTTNRTLERLATVLEQQARRP